MTTSNNPLVVFNPDLTSGTSGEIIVANYVTGSNWVPEPDSDWDRLEDMEEESDPNDPLSKFSWMEPLRNFRVGEDLYLWVKFVYNGAESLDLIECGLPEGRRPRWWSEDEENIDEHFESVFGNKILFCIEAGLAPGQPFLCKVCPPESYRCSYEYDEWDTDYFWYFVRALPQDPGAAGKSWARLLERIERYRMRRDVAKINREIANLANKRRWYLEQKVWKDSNTSKVTSIQISLLVRKGVSNMNPTLAYGNSSKHELTGTDSSQAFKRLLKDFKTKYPTESIQPILDLLGEYPDWSFPVRFSQWDRIQLFLAKTSADLSVSSNVSDNGIPNFLA